MPFTTNVVSLNPAQAMCTRYNIIQLITICEVNTRKYGPEDCDSRWPDLTEVMPGRQGSSFPAIALTKSNCFITTIFFWWCKFRKPPNTNFNVYFCRTWTEPMLLVNFVGLELNPCSLSFKPWKLWMFVPICMFLIN